MCEQTPFTYHSGQVVWVKLGSCWWPGEVRSYDELPEDAKSSLKKVPFAVVQFFDEDKYEYVRNYENVCLYNCKRKTEFIEKGLEMLKKHKDEHFMDKFPDDVVRAEELTNGNTNILNEFKTNTAGRPDYNAIFGKTGKSPRRKQPLKKNKEVQKRLSLPARRKVNLDVLEPESRIPFGRHSDSALYQPKHDHTSYIRVQPRPGNRETNTDEPSVTAPSVTATRVAATEQTYACFMCDFKSKRVEGFMAHRKSHLSSSYGAARSQVVSPKKSRKKSEGTGGKKRSSYPPSASPFGANRKRLSYSSNLQTTKTESSESERSKVVASKLVVTAPQGGQGKKVQPESSEVKCWMKHPGSKRKSSRKRKNEDVFKTQLLADWDDEDPSLLQQEEETLKKKCKASCFDFDDSADSILATELEERANKFARTRNIPIIPKPDSVTKKLHLEDLPSTSREAHPSNKRPAEEVSKPTKRLKATVDKNEEAYTKLVLGDAVPEYEPQPDSSTVTYTENNNTVLEESEESVKGPDFTVNREIVGKLPQTPGMLDVPSSSINQKDNMSVSEASDERNSKEGASHSHEQNSLDVVFCDEQETLHRRVSNSAALTSECNDEVECGKVGGFRLVASKEPTQSRVSEAASSTVLDAGPSLEAKSGELPAAAVREPERADVLNLAGVASSDVGHACQSELKSGNRDDDDDLPEIICVEHRSPNKTTVFRGECEDESELTKHVTKPSTEIIHKCDIKESDRTDVPSPDESVTLDEIHSHTSAESSGHRKVENNENDVLGLYKSSVHGIDTDLDCDDVGASLQRICEGGAPQSEGTKPEMPGADANEEVTIIGYRCGTNSFKDVDENALEKSISAAVGFSPENRALSEVQRSTESIAGVSRSASEIIDADNALIKVLEGSPDDDKEENEEICVEEDSLSTKVTGSSKTDVSREEIVAEWSDEFDEDNDVVTPVREKTIEVIDLEKSENESNDAVENESSDVVGNEEGVANLEAAPGKIVLNATGKMGKEGKGKVPITDVVRDDDMELDINSMPVVVEDAVIKEDGCSNYSCVPPSTSHISIVGTSAPASLSPPALLLSPVTTPVKVLPNNIIVVSSQSRQLPQTARGIFTSPRGKVVIMPKADKDKELAPMVVATPSGIMARLFTKTERESWFKEEKKPPLQKIRPKNNIQILKTKTLLSNVQKAGSIAETPGVKIIQTKSVILPGASLRTASPSGVVTALKVDPTGMQKVTSQGTLTKVVRSGVSKLVLQKNASNLATTSSGASPHVLKRLKHTFPLMKGSGTSAKHLVISQPSMKQVQARSPAAPVQLFSKSESQPLKKSRRMLASQNSKTTSLPLKSVPTTTIEISVSEVQTTQPVITLPSVQHDVTASTIPKIPSSTIALSGTPISKPSSLVVDSQGPPSVVFIVDSANIPRYNTSSNILSYDSNDQNLTPQSVYIEPSSITASGSLNDMVITLGESSGTAPASRVFQLAGNPEDSPTLVSNVRSGQDILAKAIADTRVFQAEASLQDTLAVVSNGESLSKTNALQGVLPSANPSEVLETLTLKEPIMTPHEVPSCVSTLQMQLPGLLAISPSMPLLTDERGRGRGRGRGRVVVQPSVSEAMGSGDES